MTIFALPDSLVKINLIEQIGDFNTSYIERVLFLVLDATLATDYQYDKDVTEAAGLLPAAAYIGTNYFYKDDVKSCDILYVQLETAIESVLSELEKSEINDRTFTASIDQNIDPLLMDFAFFKGIIQYATNAFEDARPFLKTTLLLHKIDTEDVDAFNVENANFASWFVNRTAFFDPPDPKPLDYVYDDANLFDEFTETDYTTAASNNMTYFGPFNGISYCVGYNIGAYFFMIPYYEEKVGRAVQEALFKFITSPGTFYNQENLNIITTAAFKAVAQFSKPPFGFVNLKGTFVDNIKLEDVPPADINAGIVRVNLTVAFYSIIRKIIVNIPITIGSTTETFSISRKKGK